MQTPRVNRALGFHDRRFDVHFEEGLEIFRNYEGTDYRARAAGGHWLLLNNGKRCVSLNELSQAIGTKGENAWMNWFYSAPNGERKPVSQRRDESKIRRRRPIPRTDSIPDLKDL